MLIRTILLAGVVSMSGPTPGAMDRTSKMYDLRDLAGVLPQDRAGARSSADPFVLDAPATEQNGPRAGVPILMDIPIVGNLFTKHDADQPGADPTGASPFQGRADIALSTDPISAGAGSPIDRLVGKLCGLLTLRHEELLDSVYFIDGEDENHARLSEALDQVRSLYQGRVQVEVSCYQLDMQQSPNIGDAAPKVEHPGIVAKTVAIRRTPARVQATRSVSYISRWTPIVGDSSVGLEPGTSTITDGLVLAVRVGAEKDKPRVSIRGAISKAEIQSVQAPTEQAAAATSTVLSPGGPLVTIGLPRVEHRVIDSDVTLQVKRPTVVACVPGFREGTQIVVVVSVQEVE